MLSFGVMLVSLVFNTVIAFVLCLVEFSKCSLMYKFNCTRQLHESIVVMWLCKCEVEPTENRVCRKLTFKCLN
jgi:hypothetical protein